MRLLKKLGVMAATGIVVVGLAELGEHYNVPGIYSVIPKAEARIGRPLTPVSVAGVARRSVRRCAVGVYRC